MTSLDKLFHLLKNLVNSFFLMLSWNFPFCGQCLLPLSFSLCVSEKGPALGVFQSLLVGVRSLQNRLLGCTSQAPPGSPCTWHASVPSHPSSPLAAPLSHQPFSPAVSSGPATVNTESQEDCNWKGLSGIGADVGSALSSTAAAFTDVAAATAVAAAAGAGYGGIKQTKFEKPYSRVENSKMCRDPTTSCGCSKIPCLHMHA